MRHGFGSQKSVSILLGALMGMAVSGTAPSAFAQTGSVHVQGVVVGQGYTRQAANRCFVISPTHVVDGAFDLFATRPGGSATTLAPLSDFPYDTSVLELAGPVEQCVDVPAIIGTGSLDTLLNSQASGFLLIITQSGGIQRRPVHILEVDPFYLTVGLSDGSTVQQGMSGSLVSIDGIPVGQLQSMDPDSGTGRAIRLDYQRDLTNRLFESLSPTPVASAGEGAVELTDITVPSDMITSGSADKILVTKSNPEPSGITFWRPGDGVQLVIARTGSEAVPAKILTFRNKDYAQRQATPASLMVEVKAGEGANWTLLTQEPVPIAFTFDTQDIVEIPPGTILVRLTVLPRDGAGEIALGRVGFR